MIFVYKYNIIEVLSDKVVKHIVASNACGYPHSRKLLVEGSAPKPL